jgi:hypothetical protein
VVSQICPELSTQQGKNEHHIGLRPFTHIGRDHWAVRSGGGGR